MTEMKEILWPRFVLKNSAHIFAKQDLEKSLWCWLKPMHDKATSTSAKANKFGNWKHFSLWQLLPFLYYSDAAPTELNCVVLGNLAKTNLGNSFMVKAFSISTEREREMRKNPLVEKSVLLFPLQLFCFGNWVDAAPPSSKYEHDLAT